MALVSCAGLGIPCEEQRIDAAQSAGLARWLREEPAIMHETSLLWVGFPLWPCFLFVFMDLRLTAHAFIGQRRLCFL